MSRNGLGAEEPQLLSPPPLFDTGEDEAGAAGSLGRGGHDVACAGVPTVARPRDNSD